MAEKLNRNDLCHCGSGKKYKNCHMGKDNAKIGSKIGMIALAVAVVLGLWFAVWPYQAVVRQTVLPEPPGRKLINTVTKGIILEVFTEYVVSCKLKLVGFLCRILGLV